MTTPATTTSTGFALGSIYLTPGAIDALARANQSAQEFLERHQRGDFGELDEHDRRENEFSINHGFRILSAYRTAKDVRLWIITEADRSSTTLLLPEEY